LETCGKHKNDNAFVYVVCGADEHINALNYSIVCIKKYSLFPIIVITDSKRNSKKIEHDNIIDIPTPENYSHHAASIFLKTGLHKFLPPGKTYCYLDSDVIALSEEVNSIFDFKPEPILFASDHCTMQRFSPYAVNCGCAEKTKEEITQLESEIKKHNPFFHSEKLQENNYFREFHRIAISIRNNPIKGLRLAIRFLCFLYFTHKKYFRLNQNIRYNRKNKTWIDNKDNAILFHVLNYYKKIEKESPFRFRFLKMSWVNKSGKNVYNCSCEHLSEAIKNKFNVHITDNNWQHWNGGVFLFSDISHNFLETWHQWTLQAFEDPYWKTRDQGTLIATVWKFKLNKKQRLQKKFNFIADYYNPENTYCEGKGFTYDNFRTAFNPCFIHVYHQFGNKNWEIWNAIENITGIPYHE